MNIQVHGDHMGITPALHDFVDKKLGRLEKYFDAPPEREISVTLSVEKGFHKVEVMLQLHGVLFRAEEKSADMYTSIDLVVDKLEQQINRHKSKINQRFRNQGLKTRIQSSIGMDTREESELRVVRTKRFPVKPMDVEEAMMQMDLLGHDFYVFTNAETEEVNVLYRRKSGDYGLIEPQY